MWGKAIGSLIELYSAANCLNAELLGDPSSAHTVEVPTLQSRPSRRHPNLWLQPPALTFGEYRNRSDSSNCDKLRPMVPARLASLRSGRPVAEGEFDTLGRGHWFQVRR